MVLRLTFGLSLAAAVLVASCAGEQRAGGQPNWGFTAAMGQEGAKLAYGFEGTDNVGLMLRCTRPLGRIVIEREVDDIHTAPRSFSLRSGQASRDYQVAPPAVPDGYQV